MTTKLKVSMLALLLVVSGGAFAASANISASVDRSASVDVVSDDAGLISIQDGTSGGLVYQNTSGALSVDFTKADATGVNSASNVEIGDTTDANNTYAFNVTNQDTESHTFDFEYNLTNSADDGDSNIQFQVYNDTADPVVTASEENSAVTTGDIASGETLYVVIVVDTHGLDSSDDLSGILNIAI